MSDAQDAARYRRLRVIGCAPSYSTALDDRVVLRFYNLDKFVDEDIAAHPSRGEVTRHNKPEAQSINFSALSMRFKLAAERMENLTTLPKPYETYYAIKNDLLGSGWNYHTVGLGMTDIRAAADVLADIPDSKSTNSKLQVAKLSAKYDWCPCCLRGWETEGTKGWNMKSQVIMPILSNEELGKIVDDLKPTGIILADTPDYQHGKTYTYDAASQTFDPTEPAYPEEAKNILKAVVKFCDIDTIHKITTDAIDARSPSEHGRELGIRI